jgi:hypothetical protein
MLHGTHQFSFSIQILHEGKIGYHNYGREGVMSWDEVLPFFKEDSDASFEHFSKCCDWERLNRDYRINFYGKDFDKFIQKPKPQKIYPLLSKISTVKRRKKK